MDKPGRTSVRRHAAARPDGRFGCVGAHLIAYAGGGWRPTGAIYRALTTKGIAQARVLLLAALALATACASGAAPVTQPAPTATGPAASSPAAPESPVDVTVAIPAQSLSTFPIILGQEAGIHARHGVNVSVVTMASNTAIAAVISGSVDYATPAGSIVRAINQGAPLRVVAAVSDKSNHILVVDPAVVREGKDLAGKTIAVNEIGGNTQLEAQAALQRFGL